MSGRDVSGYAQNAVVYQPDPSTSSTSSESGCSHQCASLSGTSASLPPPLADISSPAMPSHISILPSISCNALSPTCYYTLTLCSPAIDGISPPSSPSSPSSPRSPWSFGWALFWGRSLSYWGARCCPSSVPSKVVASAVGLWLWVCFCWTHFGGLRAVCAFYRSRHLWLWRFF